MKALNHALTGINFNLTLAHFAGVIPYSYYQTFKMPLNIATPAFCQILIGSYFGSVLPDIDQPYTNIHFLLKPVSNIFKRHRGITHSLIGLSVISLAMFLLYLSNHYLVYFCLSFVSGYFLHLFFDDRSTAGILWLYPFTTYVQGQNKKSYYKKRKNWHFIYKSGGDFEYIWLWFNFIYLIIIFSLFAQATYLT